MQFTKEFFDNEIRQAETLAQTAQKQVVFAEGGLSVLKQLRALVDTEEIETRQDE